MQRIIPTLFVIALFGVAALGFCMYYDEYDKHRDTTEAYSVTVSEYNDLVYKYNLLSDEYNTVVSRPSPKPVVITKIVELSYFTTVSELIVWLSNDKTDEHEYISGRYVCHNFARDLQMSAAADGYLISMQKLEYGDDGPHMINSAYITGSSALYYIEPQNDAIWLEESEFR